MIKISKQNNSLIVEGIDNAFYINNGDNSYPLNSLIVVTDNSDMATFRSVATNDVLFSGLINNITINGEVVTKDNIIKKFDAVSNSSTGGGGGGTVDAYTKEEADNKFATKTELTNVQTVANDADTKVDALTPRVESVETSLGNKQDTLVSGTNIKTINNQSILGEGNLEITGGDVDLTNYYTKTEADEIFATTTQVNHQAADISALQTDMRGKQATLVSGENIKTINSESILGNGDIQINGVSEEQAQEIAKIPTLETALNNKQDTLVSGTNIKTINSQSILGEGNIEVSGGAKIYKAAEINSDFDVQLFNCIDNLNKGVNYSQSISIGDNETIYDNFFNNIKYGDIVLMSRRIILAQYNSYLCEYRGENGGYYRFVVILNKYDNLSNFTADISIYYNKTNGTITFSTNNGGPAAKKTDIPNTDNFATKSDVPTVQTGSVGTNKNYVYSDGEISSISHTHSVVSNIFPFRNSDIIALQIYAWGDSNIAKSVTLAAATTTEAGVMSAADKTKLDSIPENIPTQTEVDNIAANVSALQTAMDGKQPTLVSGTNIKTINGNSILGEGNLVIEGGGIDLSNYYNKTEVDTKLDTKQNTLVSGTNIKTINSQSILGEGNLEVTIPDATTATSGAMSAADKTKLDSISNEWTGTQAEYDALTTKEDNIIYYVTE